MDSVSPPLSEVVIRAGAGSGQDGVAFERQQWLSLSMSDVTEMGFEQELWAKLTVILEQVGRCSSEHENQELLDPTMELEECRA